jgi:TRAP-type C4-dicarboxylate transport system permease small subunit
LGASLVFRRKGHMAFTYLYEKFPSSLQKWVDIVLNIITIIVLSIIIYESIILQKMQSNFLYFAAMPITKNYFTLPVTIGGTSIVISALLFVYDDIKEVFKK